MYKNDSSNLDSPDFEILHIGARPTWSKAGVTLGQANFKNFIKVCVVLRAHNQRAREEFDRVSSLWQMVNVTFSPRLADEYIDSLDFMSDEDGTFKIESTAGIDRKSVFKTAFQEVVNPLLTYVPQTDVYTYREYLCSSPLVLAGIQELELIRLTGTCYSPFEVLNHTLDLLKALDIFWH